MNMTACPTWIYWKYQNGKSSAFLSYRAKIAEIGYEAMLQAQESSVKNGPSGPPAASNSTTWPDVLFRGTVLLVASLAIANIAIAYRDADRQQTRVESLEKELAEVELRNLRLQTRIDGLVSDPALQERWQRERDDLLPGEEVVPTGD